MSFNKTPTNLLSRNLIISVSEARKLLGKDFDDVHDEELALQIANLSELAQTLLKYKHFAK